MYMHTPIISNLQVILTSGGFNEEDLIGSLSRGRCEAPEAVNPKRVADAVATKQRSERMQSIKFYSLKCPAKN